MKINKIKKFKKVIAVAVSAVMLSGVLAGCGSGMFADTSSSETSGLTPLKIMLMGKEPAGFSEVLKEFENKTKDTLGVKLDIEWCAQGDMKSKLQLRMASGEEYDMVFDAPFLNLRQHSSSGLYQPLESYFNNPEYPGLQKAFSDKIVNLNYMFDHLYAVPIMRTYGNGIDCVYYRKDLAEKYNIGEIDSYEKLQQYYDAIKQNDPSMIPISLKDNRGFYSMFRPNDADMSKKHIAKISAGGPFFNILLDDKNEKIVSVAMEGDATEKFSNFPEPYKNGTGTQRLEKIREWNKYAEPDSVSQKDPASQFAGGKAASFVDNYDGYEVNKTKLKAAIPEAELGTFIMVDDVREMKEGARSATYMSNNYLAIPTTSHKIDKTMKFLDWLFASEENHNLFELGIEGKDWEKVGDDQFKFPEGVDSSNAYTFPGYLMTWNPTYVRFPNTLEPKILEYKKYDLKESSYIESPLAGFIFDSTNVKTELAKVKPILDEVYNPLEHGVLDNPVETQKLNTAKARENGLNEIEAELVKQLNTFLSKKK
ncbi:MAG: ABC transporter substrate-binding protein [Oscillospiraceae bacterium]